MKVMNSVRDRRVRSALMLCLAMFAAVSCDTITKYLSASYPIHEISLIRYSITIPIGIAMGWQALRASQTGLHEWRTLFLRGFFIAFANLMFMMAAATISLADGVAIFFTMPFFVAGIVPYLIGERVPGYRWLAISIGFAGVLVMTRPGSSVFQPEALFAIGCAFFYGLGQVLTRKLDRTIPSSITSLWQSAVYTLFYACLALSAYAVDFGSTGNKSFDFLVRLWEMPHPFDLGLIVVAGLLTSIQLPLAVYAYKHSESSFAAPFEYTAMIWAVAWGYIVFGDRPDIPTMFGAAIVITAGIYMLRRDQRRYA